MDNLKHIELRKNKPTNEFSELLKKLRNNPEPPLSFYEITKEVEVVRGKRYGQTPLTH